MKNSLKLYDAARLGDVDLVNELISSDKVSQCEIDAAFSIACINGRFNIVKNLLELKDKKKRPVFSKGVDSDISATMHGFFKACQNDYLNIVKLIVLNPDLSNRPNLNSSGLVALRCAASGGSLDVLRYMIELPEVSNQFKIFENELSVLYTAIANLQDEIVKYMIFDLSVEHNAQVNKMISEFWDINYSNFVNKLFGIRDTKLELDSSIKSNKVLKLNKYWQKI